MGHSNLLFGGTAYHFLHPFGTFLVTSDRAGRAGSQQKVTWHWVFSSIPKKPSSTHVHSLAIAMSVEAKKNDEKN